MNLETRVKILLEKIKKEDKKINSFLYLNPNAIKEARELDKKSKKGKLYGKIIAVKANINIKNFPISCASKTLENYFGTYDATVIKKIKQEDGLIIGLTNMDEFAAGSSGENSAFGATQNPSAKGKITGGSSSGSAAAVAADFCDIALGSDTGGSIRNPASNCGIIGMKPSYGLVSRHGLCDLAMSLDQIGPLAKTIEDITLTLNIIKGEDENDTTTFPSETIELTKQKNITIGIPKIKGIEKNIQTLIGSKIKQISEQLNWKIKNVEVKHIDLAVQTYYPLVYVEFFSSTRRYDGRKYGKKIELVAGEEVLRRILGGKEITRAEFKGAYYQKALEVKSLLKDEINSVFKKVDCLMLPTLPFLPWNIGEGKTMSPEKIYTSDALTVLANLTETPAISIPAGKINEIPIGLQIICPKNQDAKLLSISKEIETLDS